MIEFITRTQIILKTETKDALSSFVLKHLTDNTHSYEEIISKLLQRYAS